MALFGKKKGAENTAVPSESSNTEETSAARPDENAFDFDTIARDLEAQNGASAFDDLLSQPVNPEPSGAGFDLSDFNSSGASSRPRSLSLEEELAALNNPDDVVETFPAAPEPTATATSVVTPSVPVAQGTSETPFDTKPARKKSPVLLGVGALAVLAALGAGSFFMVSNFMSPAEDETAAPTTQIDTSTPSATDSNAALTPQVKAQLKQLWEQGKAAKQKGDFTAARRYWQQALELRPGHPGFQESIDKLPG